MEELAALLFWVLGLSSYPLVFFLSLKKSVSLMSKGNAANSRTFASLIAVYLETALLPSLIAYSFPSDWPPYVASLLALASIILAAVYTLRSTFKLSFLKDVLAFDSILVWRIQRIVASAQHAEPDLCNPPAELKPPQIV